jgi:hypothetical protein
MGRPAENTIERAKRLRHGAGHVSLTVPQPRPDHSFIPRQRARYARSPEVVTVDNYAGPATLVTQDGTEIPVRTTLYLVTSRNRLPTWQGQIAGSEDLGNVYQEQGAKLRMPDGREGDVILMSYAASNPTTAVIQGSGPPPF